MFCGSVASLSGTTHLFEKHTPKQQNFPNIAIANNSNELRARTKFSMSGLGDEGIFVYMFFRSGQL